MTPEQANAVPGFTSIVQLLFAFKKKIKPSFVHPTLFVAKVATLCCRHCGCLQCRCEDPWWTTDGSRQQKSRLTDSTTPHDTTQEHNSHPAQRPGTKRPSKHQAPTSEFAPHDTQQRRTDGWTNSVVARFEIMKRTTPRVRHMHSVRVVGTY